MQYGFHHFWQNSDSIIHSIAIVLFLASCITWAIFLSQSIEAIRMHRITKKIVTLKIHSYPEYESIAQSQLGSPFQEVVSEASQIMPSIANESESDRKEWIQYQLQAGLSAGEDYGQKQRLILATVASSAPFVGLLGTVWGIYRTLVQIPNEANNSIIQLVAGPIGETLMMTALGLIVAIPAGIGYNLITRQLQNARKMNKILALKLYQYLSRPYNKP